MNCQFATFSRNHLELELVHHPVCTRYLVSVVWLSDMMKTISHNWNHLLSLSYSSSNLTKKEPYQMDLHNSCHYNGCPYQHLIQNFHCKFFHFQLKKIKHTCSVSLVSFELEVWFSPGCCSFSHGNLFFPFPALNTLRVQTVGL